jgi:hypothetical protein
VQVEALSAALSCLALLPPQQQLLLWTDPAPLPAGSSGPKRVLVVTGKVMQQELAYALAVRAYLRVAGPGATPIKPLELARAQCLPGQGGSGALFREAQQLVRSLAWHGMV